MSKTEEWIETFTQKCFFPFDPNPTLICIEDIAHSLAMTCRFNRHCRVFYSVAQHCVIVSEMVPAEDALWGLLHDAGEAYLPDIPRPIKHKKELRSLVEAERKILKCVAQVFGLQLPIPVSIKRADNIMLATEARDLMGEDCQGRWESLKGITARPEQIIPWTWENAERTFLYQFRNLVEGRLSP